MEKVSIIISVYNSEKYLVECIESALNQTYGELEIIAVFDEGSRDNSLTILKKYSEKVKIISKNHGSLGSSLNAGIKGSTGIWIKQLDSDDILYPDAVEALMSETKKLSDKTNTIIYSDYDFIDSNGERMGNHLEPNYNGLTKFDFNVILLDHHIGNPGTLLISKSIFEKYGYYDDSLKSSEDYDLRLRHCVLHNCQMRLIPRKLLKYRMHQTQKSRTTLRNGLEQDKILRRSILDKLNPNERSKYELSLADYRLSLVNYQKTRPLISKLIAHADKNLLPHLPKYLSLKLMKAYWNLERKISNKKDPQ